MVVVVPHIVVVVDDEHPVFSAFGIVVAALVHTKASAKGIVVALHEDHIFPIDGGRKNRCHGVHARNVGSFVSVGVVVVVTAEKQAVCLADTAFLLQGLQDACRHAFSAGRAALGLKIRAGDQGGDLLLPKQRQTEGQCAHQQYDTNSKCDQFFHGPYSFYKSLRFSYYSTTPPAFQFFFSKKGAPLRTPRSTRPHLLSSFSFSAKQGRPPPQGQRRQPHPKGCPRSAKRRHPAPSPHPREGSPREARRMPSHPA